MRPKLKKLKQILMENPYEGPAIRGQEENTENRVKKILLTQVYLMILCQLKRDKNNLIFISAIFFQYVIKIIRYENHR